MSPAQRDRARAAERHRLANSRRRVATAAGRAAENATQRESKRRRLANASRRAAHNARSRESHRRRRATAAGRAADNTRCREGQRRRRALARRRKTRTERAPNSVAGREYTPAQSTTLAAHTRRCLQRVGLLCVEVKREPASPIITPQVLGAVQLLFPQFGTCIGPTVCCAWSVAELWSMSDNSE